MSASDLQTIVEALNAVVAMDQRFDGATRAFARSALALAERMQAEAGKVAPTSDLVTQLRAWGPLVSSGYECPAAGTTMHRAAEEIERLSRELEAAKAKESTP